MRIIKIIIPVLFLSLISLTSCKRDYFRRGSGTVLDADTEKPIDSVMVESFLVSNNGSSLFEQIYCDSVGNFETFIGPFPYLSSDVDLIVLLSKDGYTNLVLKNPRDSKILLKKKGIIDKQKDRRINEIVKELRIRK